MWSHACHTVAFKIRRNNMNDKKYSLRPYLLAYKWHYAIGIFVLLAVDLANLYIPQFIGEIIDGITEVSLIWRAWAALYLRY